MRTVKYNKNRDKFFKEVEGENLEHFIMKYTKTTLGKRYNQV